MRITSGGERVGLNWGVLLIAGGMAFGLNSHTVRAQQAGATPAAETESGGRGEGRSFADGLAESEAVL